MNVLSKCAWGLRIEKCGRYCELQGNVTVVGKSKLSDFARISRPRSKDRVKAGDVSGDDSATGSKCYMLVSCPLRERRDSGRRTGNLRAITLRDGGRYDNCRVTGRLTRRACTRDAHVVRDLAAGGIREIGYLVDDTSARAARTQGVAPRERATAGARDAAHAVGRRV